MKQVYITGSSLICALGNDKFQLPTIGYHTVEETTTIKSIESTIKILSEIYLP